MVIEFWVNLSSLVFMVSIWDFDSCSKLTFHLNKFLPVCSWLVWRKLQSFLGSCFCIKFVELRVAVV